MRRRSEEAASQRRRLLSRRPPTVVPMGDQKASWHYACQFYRQASWYTQRNHTLSVMTQGSGECGEGGSTELWDRVLRG